MRRKPKAPEIGLRQARQLCGMSTQRQLAFIAEGLPIIFQSAESLVHASRPLAQFPREAEILERHAEEESAKILILIDIVRCPPTLAASRTGFMIRWFYDHLARLLYAEAQGWKPTSVAELQEYIDNERRSHYLEGEYSEYIMPNWTLFCRESSLYADIARDENSGLSWISPLRQVVEMPFEPLAPASYRVSEALAAFGAFTLPGLEILREVWGNVNFDASRDWSLSRDLCYEMAKRLETAGLITDQATEEHMRLLYTTWQIPMYNIDFLQIPVSLEELNRSRERTASWEW